MKKKQTKEQTIVVTMRLTYILKDDNRLGVKTLSRDKEMFPIEDLDPYVAPNADHVEVVGFKVFEKE